MAIKLVVFDMAGTTVKDADNVHQALQNALEKSGYKVSREEVNEVMGYPKPVAIRRLLKSKDVAESKIENEAYIKQIHQHFVDEMIDFYAHHQEVKEKPQVRETFAALRSRNIKVAIDTGFSRDIADTIMDRLGWKTEAIFDYSVTSDEVANGRPFPDMIYKAMEQAGIDNPQEVAKVGDTVSDLQQGEAAKCKLVIGVTTGAYKKEELIQYAHTHLIEQLDQVVEIIDKVEVEQAV